MNQHANPLGHWLEEKCRREDLSLREASARTGLSHATIANIIKGTHPLPETIRKLATSFGGGDSVAFADHLLVLAGYRTEQSQDGQPAFMKKIPLLCCEYQHMIEVLVGEFAKIEGIEVPTSEGEA